MCGLPRRVVVASLVILMVLGTAAQAEEPPLSPEQQEKIKERDRLSDESTAALSKGDYAHAIADSEKAMAIEREVFGEVHDEVAGTLGWLCKLHAENGDFNAARRTGKEALAQFEKLHGAEHFKTTRMRHELTYVEALEKLDEEDRAKVRAGRAAFNQGKKLTRSGQAKQATPFFRRAIELWLPTLGENLAETRLPMSWLGNNLVWQRQFGEAQQLLDRALAIAEKSLGKEHADLADILFTLGKLQSQQGKPAAALPYLERCLAIHRKWDEPLNTALALNDLGLVLEELGKLPEAQKCLEESLAIKQKHLGKDDQELALAQSNLGFILNAQGKIKDALARFEQAQAIYAKAGNQRSVAMMLNLIGGVQINLSNMKKAQECYEEALTLRRKLLGEEHLETAGSLNNLGYLYSVMGDRDKALEYYEKALPIYRKILGDNHPSTATALANIGAVLSDLRRYAEARPYHEQALAIRRKVYGDQHPVIASSLSNLGFLHMELGEYQTARPKFEQALAICRKSLGDQHPQTQFMLGQMADLLREMGKFHDARPYYDQALALARKNFGENHRRTALLLNNLARLLWEQGSYTEAGKLYEQSLAIQRKIFGPDHPNTIVAQSNIAELLRDEGKYDESLKHYQAVLAIVTKARGEEHLDTASTLVDLGILLQMMGKFQTAEENFQRALAIRRKVLGAKHTQISNSLLDLVRLNKERGDLPQARRYAEEALEIARASKDRRWQGSVLADLGGVLKRQGDFAAARKCYEEALAISRAVLGDNHQNTATDVLNLGILLMEAGDYAQARKYIEEGLGTRLRNLGADTPRVAGARRELAMVLEDQGEVARAREEYQAALDIFTKVYGRDHLETAGAMSAMASFLWYQGDNAQSRRLYEEALATAKKTYGENHYYVANLFNDLAAQLSSEDPDTARGYYEKALAIRRATLGDDHYKTAVSHGNLAESLRKAKQLDLATEYLQKALAIRLKVYGEVLWQTGVSYSSLGTHYLALKKPAEAKESLERALAIFQKIDGAQRPRVAETYRELALVAGQEGDYATAEKHLEQALALQKKCLPADHPERARSLFLLGNVKIAQAKYAEARPYYEEAYLIRARQYRDMLPTLSEAEALAFVGTSRPGRNPLLSALYHLSDVPAEQAYQVVWQTRGAVTRAMARRRLPAHASPEVHATWEKLANTRSQLARLTLAPVPAEQLEERHQLMARLTAEKEVLERQLAAAHVVVTESPELLDRGYEQLWRLLPANTAVVDIVQVLLHEPPRDGKGEPTETLHYEAFVLHKPPEGKGSISWVHLGPAAPIDAAVTAWRQAIVASKISSDRDAPDQVLRRLVWLPLEAKLTGCKAVIIIPDAGLTRVPWAALPGPRPGFYLLEQYALATVSHGQQLLELLGDRPAPSSKQEFLVVGGVHYDAAGDAPTEPPQLLALRGPAVTGQPLTWNPLKATQQEAEEVARLWPSLGPVKLLHGAAASKQAVREHLARAQCIHLATHGFFADPVFRSAYLSQTPLGSMQPTASSRSPLVLSGVVLAGANQAHSAAGNGILTAEEVVGLDLGRADLVVLSACETGLGEVAGGEGVLGLQRAFHLAGAQTTVASLWKVDDAVTQKLMTRFYENLWQKKLPKLEALRQAQLSILYDLPQSTVPRGLDTVDDHRPAHTDVRANPRLWAAWVLSGDPGDLSQVTAISPPVASAVTPPTDRAADYTLALVAGAVVLALLLLAGIWRLGRRHQPMQ